MVDATVGDDETYLLLLLADGNLPTGSFVASSGLESFVTHGFLGASTDNLNTVDFIRDSVATYARSTLPFVADVHQLVTEAAADGGTSDLAGPLGHLCEGIKALDDLYEAMTLNHVGDVHPSLRESPFLPFTRRDSHPRRRCRRNARRREMYSSGSSLTNTN